MTPLLSRSLDARLKNGAAMAVMCRVALPPGCGGNPEQRAQ